MKRIFVIILLISLAYQANAQSPIEVGKKYSIISEILEEEREVWIGLPAYYDSTVSYPTIYVMDAEWQFDITLAMTKELAANDKMPEHIVIGIPNINPEHRFRELTFTSTELRSDGTYDSTLVDYFGGDKTGGGLTFYKHLTDEVLPFVEKKHKTNGFDVYIGHSLSGYYGAYILSMKSPFEAFQLYDPSIWYNGGDVISHLAKDLPENFKTNVFISSAAGGKDRQQYNINTQAKLHVFLNEQGINSELKVYEDEDHGSVRLPSLIDGLSNLYNGFSIGYILPTDEITVSDAQAHYSSFSKKVNYTFSCPVGAYRWIGHANHAQENWIEAIKAFELCLDAFSEDARFLFEVADSYYEMGDFKRSLDYYEELLLMAPENDEFILKVEELKRLIK